MIEEKHGRSRLRRARGRLQLGHDTDGAVGEPTDEERRSTRSHCPTGRLRAVRPGSRAGRSTRLTQVIARQATATVHPPDKARDRADGAQPPYLVEGGAPAGAGCAFRSSPGSTFPMSSGSDRGHRRRHRGRRSATERDAARAHDRRVTSVRGLDSGDRSSLRASQAADETAGTAAERCRLPAGRRGARRASASAKPGHRSHARGGVVATPTVGGCRTRPPAARSPRRRDRWPGRWPAAEAQPRLTA